MRNPHTTPTRPCWAVRMENLNKDIILYSFKGVNDEMTILLIVSNTFHCRVQKFPMYNKRPWEYSVYKFLTVEILEVFQSWEYTSK